MMTYLRSLLRNNLISNALRLVRRRRRFARLDEDDRRRIRFYSQFVRPGDLAFDVGANYGNRTKAFLALGARVVAFEPQPDCANYLELALGRERRFQLVQKALGDKAGRAEMRIANHNVLSTLSSNWIEATSKSGRFSSESWGTTIPVDVTTLDSAIDSFGTPSFVKIDVEGFELEVLSGLSKPVQSLSIEYTAEFLESTFQCIDRLEKIAPYTAQISEGESLHLNVAGWTSLKDLRSMLKALPPLSVGDVYFRIPR